MHIGGCLGAKVILISTGLSQNMLRCSHQLLNAHCRGVVQAKIISGVKTCSTVSFSVTLNMVANMWKPQSKTISV